MSSGKNSYVERILRCLGITTGLGLLVIFCVFYTIQLMFAIWKMETFHEVIPLMIWLFPLPLGIASMISYLLKGRRFLSFFADWAVIERKIIALHAPKESRRHIKTICLTIYILYLGFLIAIPFSFSQTFYYSNPDHPSTMLDYPGLTSIFSAPFLAFLSLASLAINVIFISMEDIVPSFFYYHAAGALYTLEIEIFTRFIFFI